MTWSLIGSIIGLAVLDSFNPATLVAVALILLASRRRPVAETLGFVLGAFLCVVTVGGAVYLGADAAASAIGSGLTWLRRVAFGLASAVLLWSAVRALRPRHRTSVGLPPWFNPFTAVGLGIAMTGADLPNAFPYLIAIERLVTAHLSVITALLVLCGYAVIYCLPCLALLAVGLSRGDRTRRLLHRLHDRFGAAGVVPASRTRAALLLVASVALAIVAGTA